MAHAGHGVRRRRELQGRRAATPALTWPGSTHSDNDTEAGGGAGDAENGENIVGVDDSTLEELGLAVSYRYR